MNNRMEFDVNGEFHNVLSPLNAREWLTHTHTRKRQTETNNRTTHIHVLTVNLQTIRVWLTIRVHICIEHNFVDIANKFVDV